MTENILTDTVDFPNEEARAALPIDKVEIGKRRTFWGDAWYRFRQRKLALVGLLLLLFIVLATLVGPFIYPQSWSEIDFKRALLTPRPSHPFGTNDLGQDMFARVLFGGRLSIAVGLFAMAVAISLGTFIGLVSGFFGGLVDNLLMRFTDLFLSLPVLPLLMVVIYLFRDPIRNLVGAQTGIFILIVTMIGVMNWMPVARLVRGTVLSVREKPFITAARSMGATPARLIFKYVLPNTMGPVIVAATLSVGNAIITESTLSFLGLGFPPDIPTWGRMLYDSQNYLDIATYLSVFPGLMIFITVLSVNAVGDGLRDALDPRMKER
jgi:peptide/nickel transport system permease protein